MEHTDSWTSRAIMSLRKIYFIMKCTGIYVNDRRTPRKYLIPYIAYTILAWLLSFVDVVRILMLFEKREEFGAEVVNKVTALVAYFASLLVYTCCFLARNKFAILHDSWVKLVRHRAKKPYYTDYSGHLRRVGIGIYITMAAVPSGLLIYFIYYTWNSTPEPDPREILIPKWYKDLPVPVYRALSLTHIILKSISTMAICAFVGLIVMTSAILQREFSSLKDQLVKAVEDSKWGYTIEEEGNGDPNEMTLIENNLRQAPHDTLVAEDFRLIHDKIIHLVGIADDIFHICIGVALFLAMGTTILIMYNSAKSYAGMTTVDPFVIYVILLVVFALGVQITIIGSSVSVNIAAHSPLQVLYSIDLRLLPQQELFPVNLFIQRLSSDSIGYRPLRLFTISAATTLTIAGALVTYTIVIFEVTGDDKSCPPASNTNISKISNETLYSVFT